MSDGLEEGVAHIKGMGLQLDEEQIREALKNCNNNPVEAMQLLMPESPEDANLYNLISTQTSTSSYGRDIDMRDTETHPGSGGDSDRDSTTVSYSVDEERNIEVEEEEEEAESQGLQFQDNQEDTAGGEFPPRPDGPPPRYEDIVTSNQGDSPLPTEDPPQEIQPCVAPEGPPEMTSSIEFPLTHFYELESRVHTEQWSIPYKREESLAICMMATTNMIREGE